MRKIGDDKALVGVDHTALTPFADYREMVISYTEEIAVAITRAGIDTGREGGGE